MACTYLLSESMAKRQVSEVWGNAELIAPALISYMRNSAHDVGWNWMATLRALSKCWFIHVTAHIKAVRVLDGKTAHLASSLGGSLAHLQSVSIKVPHTLNLNHHKGKGGLEGRMDEGFLFETIFNSRLRIRSLQIDFGSICNSANRRKDISASGRLMSLTQLDVSHTWNLDILKACPNLVKLHTSHCRLQRSDLKHLPVLTYLYICCTELAGFLPADLDGLDLFPNSLSVTELHVKNHNLSDRGAEEVGEILRSLPKLTKCTLDIECFGEFELYYNSLLLKSLPLGLKEFELWGCTLCGHHLLAELRYLTQLQSLSVGPDTDWLEYENFEWVSNLTNLRSLSIWGSSIDASACTWFYSLTKLKFLSLNMSELSLLAFIQLSYMCGMREIHLGVEAVDHLVSISDSENDLRLGSARLTSRGTVLSPPLLEWKGLSLS